MGSCYIVRVGIDHLGIAILLSPSPGIRDDYKHVPPGLLGKLLKEHTQRKRAKAAGGRF